MRENRKYGAAGETVAWRAVYEHYYWDRLDDAYNSASALGAGNMGHGLVGFRMIEGEHMTRQRGSIEQVCEWLQVETIHDEVSQSEIAQNILDSCNQIAERFAFDHGSPTLVSVLSKDSNVPWMPGRHGYCMDKYPYDKICIPNSALQSHEELDQVIAHEYAHVINLNLSSGKCPLWLDEALAMVAGGGVDRRAWKALVQNERLWLKPSQLSAAFLKNREDAEQREQVWFAYQQSAAIGFYLVSIKSERALSDLMRAFSNNSIIQDIVARFTEDGLTNEALHEVYGTNTDNLFRDSYQWLKGLGHA